MLKFEDIRFDCALYTGYKPCRHGNECASCGYYEPLAWQGGTPGEAVRGPQSDTPALDSAVRILIIKTGAMGDVLRTTTLLPALKREYPKSRITWITDPPSLSLLRANPMVDELFEFSPANCDILAARDFDILLNYEKEKEPLALSARIRASKRLGFAATRWNTATVFNRESEYGLLLGLSDELKFRVNEKVYPQIICEMAGLEYRRDPYVLGLTPESHARRHEIEALIGSGERLRVGVNSGCGNVFQTKQWTLKGWVELIEFLQARANAEILLLGGKAEMELNRHILDRTRGVFDTGCGNSLEQFFGVVDACDLIVTSDSLAMHIAIALGKHTVTLFGSTSHQEIDLYDNGEKIVTDFDCSPCYLKTCGKTPTCMEALRGETVGEVVLKGLVRISHEHRRDCPVLKG